MAAGTPGAPSPALRANAAVRASASSIGIVICASGVWCRYRPNTASQNSVYSRVIRMNSCHAASTAFEGIPISVPPATWHSRNHSRSPSSTAARCSRSSPGRCSSSFPDRAAGKT